MASLELISHFPSFARSGPRVRKRDGDVFRSPIIRSCRTRWLGWGVPGNPQAAFYAWTWPTELI